MFERFTNLAKRAIAVAQQEAIGLGHDFIGTEHVLLGLIGAGEGIAGEVLREHGLTADRVRTEAVRQLEAAGITGDRGAGAKEALATIGIDIGEIQRRADDTFGPGKFQYPRPAFTPRAKTMLGVTLREARELGQEDHIETQHLLLGLLAQGLADGDGRAFKVLLALQVDPAELRTETLTRANPAA